MEVISLNSPFSSIKPKEFQVDFVNVPDKYPLTEDLVCTYTRDTYATQEGDRIAIFKLGWKFIKEYVVFEWAPTTTDSTPTVTFSKSTLPNDSDMYQFCYITHENEILGVSPLFQFCGPANEQERHPRVDSTTTSRSNPEKSLICTKKHCQDLQEENFILRETLKRLVLGNSSDDVKELKATTKILKDTLARQQNEIIALKQVILEIAKKESASGNDSGVGSIPVVNKGDDNFEFGELQSIPPFPFAK